VKKNLREISPWKILGTLSQKGPGPGNLGVIIARAGLGKTACLVHLGLEKLLGGEKIVHVSLEGTPDKVLSYYDILFYDILKAAGNNNQEEISSLLQRNRVVLAYLNQSFQIERLKENLDNLSKQMDFVPDTLIVDGLEFGDAPREVFEEFQQIAQGTEAEIWFSALAHRHITEVNERGIPYPCNNIDEFFALIAQLEPVGSGVVLKILKDHEVPVPPDASVLLDPKTLLPK